MQPYSFFPTQYLPIVVVLVLVDLVLRGFALWKSARNDQMYWFIALIIFNTLGILPLIYLIIYRNIPLRKKKG